jgi:hypothetical protein
LAQQRSKVTESTKTNIMKKADAIIQTVLIGVCMLTLPTMYIPMLVLLAIGVWQLVSSSVAILYRKNTREIDRLLLKIYWYAVAGYALISIVFYFLPPADEVLIFWLAVLPWTYAIYCTTITYLRAYKNISDDHRASRKNDPRFLDNIDL